MTTIINIQDENLAESGLTITGYKDGTVQLTIGDEVLFEFEGDDINPDLPDEREIRTGVRQGLAALADLLPLEIEDRDFSLNFPFTAGS